MALLTSRSVRQWSRSVASSSRYVAAAWWLRTLSMATATRLAIRDSSARSAFLNAPGCLALNPMQPTKRTGVFMPRMHNAWMPCSCMPARNSGNCSSDSMSCTTTGAGVPRNRSIPSPGSFGSGSNWFVAGITLIAGPSRTMGMLQTSTIALPGAGDMSANAIMSKSTMRARKPARAGNISSSVECTPMRSTISSNER